MQVIYVTRFQALYLAAPKEGREAIRDLVLDSPGGGLVAFSPRGVETQPQNVPPRAPLLTGTPVIERRKDRTFIISQLQRRSHPQESFTRCHPSLCYTHAESLILRGDIASISAIQPSLRLYLSRTGEVISANNHLFSALEPPPIRLAADPALVPRYLEASP